MAGGPRSDVVREGEIATYHCWSRCVQRMILCGEDPLTGRDFSYRRTWIENLLLYQASTFGVDLGNYEILGNHFHTLPRTRPDIVATWSDEEVACRWRAAWPKWNGTEWVREPNDDEVLEVLSDPRRLSLARRALSSVSWFMARIKEPIARLCNIEMETGGHFWDQRFGCRELTSDAAVLTCMVYIDINQIKAGMTQSLEESEHSAIAARLAAWRMKEAQASVDEFHKLRMPGYELDVKQVERLLANSFLAPISDDSPLITLTGIVSHFADSQSVETAKEIPSAAETTPSDDTLVECEPPEPAIQVESTEPKADATPPMIEGLPTSELGPGTDAQGGRAETTGADGKPTQSPPNTSTPFRPDRRRRARERPTVSRSIYRRVLEGRRRRASDNAILPMPFTQYREIVEWAASQARFIPESPPTIPQWLGDLIRPAGLDPGHWYQAVDQFERWFGRAVGAIEQLQEVLERTGHQWLHGQRRCRATFG